MPRGHLRVLLAALLMQAGHPVAADALADVVWDGSAPPGATVTLRTHVLRLRRALGPQAGARLVTQQPGYQLQAGEDEVDVLRFRGLCRDGNAALRKGAWARAEGLLGEALGLWRGAPLADVPCDLLLREEVPGLENLRLQAEEWRADAALHLGRHDELVTGLQALAAEHPLRERFHAHLMLALYRCGRQAEALAAYQQARQVLIDEVGTEPGPELRQLHQQVLSADPALAEPASAREPRARTNVPRQLPMGVRDFIGRSDELLALTGALNESGAATPGTVVVSAIAGTAGIGKTALALNWAHQVVDRFPDGQLHVNLHGFDPSGPPGTPEAAIRGFLMALGLEPQRIPPDLEAQAGMYRSLLADRRMLIVLDNARDEQQVRPLLPASPGSLVLVTSRSQLSGLVATDCARLLILDILSHAEAVQLLTARIGLARAAADADAVGQIAMHCGCLPLALAIAAARAAAEPSLPLRALAAELRDGTGRMDALDAGDPAASVRAVFSSSYHQLTAEAARMFRLLGLHAGPDIAVPAVASLIATEQPETRRLLSELTGLHLISEHVPGRYAFHDLLRAYAADQARACDNEPERRQAIGRILDHYLHSAAHGAFTLNPRVEPVTLSAPRPGTDPERPAGLRGALAWFDAEHLDLLAAVGLAAESRFDNHAWQLPWAMTPFLRKRGHWQEWAATQREALAAAIRLSDVAGQAVSRRLLGDAYNDLGDYEQAPGCYMASLELYRRLGNCRGEARTLTGLGMLAARQERYVDALAYDEQSLRLYRTVGDKAGEAVMLFGIGWDHCLLSDFEQARAVSRQALTLNAEAGNRDLDGAIWNSLGYAEHHLGHLTEAAACYQRALVIGREFGDRWGEAVTLSRLGDTRHATGDLPQARKAWQQSLTILDDLDHPYAEEVRAKLADRTSPPDSGASA
ncbi:MAG TPA: BTAD domain-containing putative transcriptional regulator [Trebonia sp.]|nr:BTAD domain-containing putative transcriptional regulator [Trebonia sp.]